jgi:hypothetical protein
MMVKDLGVNALGGRYKCHLSHLDDLISQALNSQGKLEMVLARPMCIMIWRLEFSFKTLIRK